MTGKHLRILSTVDSKYNPVRAKELQTPLFPFLLPPHIMLSGLYATKLCLWLLSPSSLILDTQTGFELLRSFAETPQCLARAGLVCLFLKLLCKQTVYVWVYVCVCAFGAQRLLSGSSCSGWPVAHTPRASDRYVLPHSAFHVSAAIWTQVLTFIQ